MNDRIRHRQRAAGEEFLLRRRVARTLRLEMHRVNLAPAPVEREERVLILRRELRAVAEGHAGRRTGTDVQRGGKVVRIKLRPFARTIAPAPFAAAGDVVDAGRPVPRRVEIVLHVRVVGEELAVSVERTIEDVAEAGGVEFPVFPVRREAVDHAAGCETIPIVTAPVRHAFEHMVFAPIHHHAGRIHFGQVGVVAGNQEHGLAVGRRKNGVNPVVATGFDRAEQFHLVERVVIFRRCDAIHAAGNFLLVIVYTDVESAEGPEHSVHGANLRWHLFHLRRVERLAGRRRREAIQPAVLITGDDAALRVGAKIHPRSLLAAGHGVEQLDLEIFRGLDAAGRRGLVLADGAVDGRAFRRRRIERSDRTGKDDGKSNE